MKYSVLYADSQVVFAVETVTLMCHVILRGYSLSVAIAAVSYDGLPFDLFLFKISIGTVLQFSHVFPPCPQVVV